MSQSARTPSLTNRTDGTNRSTKKPSDTLRPHYYTTFQNSCCASKANVTSSTQNKDVLPIPAKFKKDVENFLTPINGLLIEELSKVASYTSVIPDIFFEKNDNFQIQKYLIDRVMLRTLEEADIINWNVKLKKLYPIRTSGNGNCLLHAVLIAMIGIHDIDLYLRDRLAQFMNDNKDLLKTHWRIERLKSDKTYGISSEDSELDGEWKELCDLVHYENSEDGQAAAHLEFLEAVHIFSVCNMLHRPIIVLSEDVIRNKNGEAISVNDLYGIYLPILSSPSECINEPIVLAYDRSHFCPLQTSNTNEQTLDNLLPLYSSLNHILEGNLLPIRFLGDDVTVERSNNLLRDYLRIKQIDHTFDSSPSAVPILCAELGGKYLSTKDNFFLLYSDYLYDFFEIQKPKAIKEEQERERQRELDDYVSRYTSPDIYGRSVLRYDTSPMRSSRTSYTTTNDSQLRNQNSRSYDLDHYSDDLYTSGAYIPRNGPSYFENYPRLPQQSQRLPDYTKNMQREPTISQPYYESLKIQSPASNPDIISNPNSNEKLVNSVNIQIQGTDSKLNQERPQPTSIQIPIQVLKPSSSSDNQNLTIYEQRRALRDLCILCDQPFNDWQSMRICPTCDYKIRYPSVYDDIRSRPNTRSRSTNIYLPTSDRDYTTSLSPVPKIRPSNKIICPHCKNPNLLYNLTRNTEFRCSACQNPISSADRY